MNRIELIKSQLDQITKNGDCLSTSQFSSSLHFIIENFKTLTETSPPNLQLKKIAIKIKEISPRKLNYYRDSRFGNIKEILSIIRNFFTLGVAKSSGQLGLDLSKQYLERTEVCSLIEKNERVLEEIKSLENKKPTLNRSQLYSNQGMNHADINLTTDIDTCAISNIEQSIINQDIKALRQSLSSFSISCLDGEKQAFIMAIAYEHYSKEIVELLQKNLCSEVEKKFPLVNHYQSLPRHLNPTHLELYGEREEAQKIYHLQQKESVKYALLAIKENNCSFRKLLENLGLRRRHTDVMTSTPIFLKERNIKWQASDFGRERKKSVGIPVAGAYTAYKYKVVAENIFITLQGKTYTLKITSQGVLAYNPYEEFWKEKDPIFAYAENLYNKIANDTFDDPEELKKRIATFHWLLANCPPFVRGTASVLEALTDAMWLAHGYLPQPIKPGKSLDLEALCTPSIDDFVKIYPIGLKLANT